LIWLGKYRKPKCQIYAKLGDLLMTQIQMRCTLTEDRPSDHLWLALLNHDYSSGRSSAKRAHLLVFTNLCMALRTGKVSHITSAIEFTAKAWDPYAKMLIPPHQELTAIYSHTARQKARAAYNNPLGVVA
jgi:hypothetical protein